MSAPPPKTDEPNHWQMAFQWLLIVGGILLFIAGCCHGGLTPGGRVAAAVFMALAGACFIAAGGSSFPWLRESQEEPPST